MERMSKRLHQMGAYSDGTEIESVKRYCLDNWPDAMIGLLYGFDGYVGCIHAWACGFAYALHVIEDNGIPVDLDEVLHSNIEGERVDLKGELERLIAERG